MPGNAHVVGADAEAEGLLKRGKAPDSTSAASPSGASSSHGETATPFMLQRGPAEFAPAGAGRSRSGRSAAAMDRAAPQPMQSPTHQYHTSHWPSSQVCSLETLRGILDSHVPPSSQSAPWADP